MIAGALLSGWRGRSAMYKGLLTLLLLFTCFARAQVVDARQFANPQQQQQALNIASQLRCPQCQNQNLLESNAPVAVGMRHQVYSMVAEGKVKSKSLAG